jgi:hypothetical protein
MQSETSLVAVATLVRNIFPELQSPGHALARADSFMEGAL